MTTSRVYSLTAGDVIANALRDARIIPAEQTIQQVDYQNGLDSLNRVSKYWQTKGIHLWLIQRAILPLNVGQQSYSLGPTGDPCGYSSGFYYTTITANAATNATSLTVASSTGMLAAPNILTSDPTGSTSGWTVGNSATLSTSSGLVVTNGAASAGYATYDLAATVGRTYRVRFSYTKGTSASAVFSVLNGAVVASTSTLSASAVNQELVITATLNTITFKVANSSAVNGQNSTVYGLQYVDDKSGSRLGLQLDNGSMFWTYVLNVNSATAIDLTAGITSGATSGNQVDSFQVQIDRPLRILDPMFNASVTSSGIPVNPWSRQEYMQQPSKNTQGSVVNWYYNPTLTNGALYVWQVANSVLNTLDFDVRKPLTVYSNISDPLDYPDDYYLALTWAIAADLGPQYGIKQDRQMILEQKALDIFESTIGNDNEIDSMFIAPDRMGR